MAFPFIAYGFARSSVITRQGDNIEQPIPFSHRHHVGDDGIDCRYCHTSVEHSTFAGLPSTETCVGCHSQLWTQASVLQPLRDSWSQHKPIIWNRVYNLPDFVFFNHEIHVHHGVGCSTCHGDVSTQALTRKSAPLTMQWCMDCHRWPEQYLRPLDKITDPHWQPPPDQLQRGAELVRTLHIEKTHLVNCDTCHR
ncbi:MAG TPA: cytochrome c3 family protein [Candidatus Xenobia bacterium]